jgi:aryl-alcohol dehydrogenase-like predicted oxidoreductase
MSASSQFATTDHRNFNRDGAAFNVGETFAGLPFSRGLELVETLRPWVPADWTMSEWALRWCLDFPEVTTVIPGATRPQQATGNARASQLEPLSKAVHEKISELYREQIASWIRGKY